MTVHRKGKTKFLDPTEFLRPFLKMQVQLDRFSPSCDLALLASVPNCQLQLERDRVEEKGVSGDGWGASRERGRGYEH